MQVTVAGRPVLGTAPGVQHRSHPAARAKIGAAALCGCAATLVAFGMRCWLLGTPSLWYDEGVSWSLARLPVASLLTRLATTDFNPPFYGALLHFWLFPAGEKEYALRYLSVLSGTLAAPLCWVLARRLFASAMAAAAAAFLAATSVFLIDFSQETRGYSLAAALGVLSAYALVRLLDAAPGAALHRWWWAYLLATTAALYTHYAVLLLMPGHVVLVLLRRRRRLAVGTAWLGGAALYLPWLPALDRQLATMRAAPDFWAGHIALTLAPERVLAAVAIAPGALPNQTGLLFAGGVIWLVLAVAAALFGSAHSKAAALLPTLLVLLPLLEAALLTAVFPKFIDRYLLPVAPFAYVSLAGAAGLARRRLASPSSSAVRRLQPWRGAGPAATGLLLLATLLHAAAHLPQGAQAIKDGDTRTVVAFIGAHAQPGDAVLLAQDTSPVFSYYAEKVLTPAGIPWFGVVREFSRGDDLPTLAAALNRAAQGHSRLWVLLWHTDFSDPTGYLRNALDVGATRRLTFKAAANYELRLYQLRPGTRFTPRAAPLQPMSVHFGPHITFLGVGLEEGSRPADLPFVAHIWFRTDAPLDRDYQVVLRLERDGHVWSQYVARPSLYTYPAQHWLPGVDVPGRLDFVPGVETPPADYHLTLALYDPVAHQDLSAVDAVRGAIGTRVDLGVVHVMPAQQVGTPAPPARVLNLPVARGLQLWGTDAIPTHVEQGATLDLTLLWKATGQPQGDYAAQLELAPEGTTETPLALTVSTPPTPGLSTLHWPVGGAFEDMRTLQLPARTPIGPAALQVRVHSGTGPDRVLSLATITVDARARETVEPADIGTPIGAIFGGAALLAGIQIDDRAAQPGGQAVVLLTWLCRDILHHDYTVFVHLLDGANNIGGRQHDGPPANGAEPTTSWIPGQWISDRHAVPIPTTTPPGTYRLEVGLYRQTGEQFVRLPLAADGDAVIAGTVTVR
ncbi:MAG TPA: glycosyltransferase family 39 protein [Chloroflexota bacterium]|nr:glycosyltransferase family 39 protein [Chloroflexota bacterium]